MTKISAFMVRPRGYIDVSDYVPQSDAADCFAGIQAALADGFGREIVFRAPYGGSRQYRLLNRASGRLIVPAVATLTWDANAWINTEAWGKSGTANSFLRADAVTTDLVLDVPAVAGTRTITVPTGQGATFARGDAFIINSTELYTPLDGPIGTIGEWAEVSSVSGDVLALTATLKFGYDTALGTVKIHRSAQWLDVTLNNPQIQGPGLFSAANTRGDRGIEFLGVKSLTVEGGEVRDSDAHSLIVHNAYAMRVTGFSSRKFEASPPGDTRTRYGLSIIGNTSIVRVTDCDFTGGTEQVALTTSGYPSGVKRNVVIRGNRFTGAERSGITTHYDYDPDSYLIEGNQFYDCLQAADMRLGGTFNDNIVRSTTGGLDCAVQLGAGMEAFSASGNDIEDVLRGYYMPAIIDHFRPPGKINISGDVMRNVRGQGVLLDYNGGSGGSVDADLGALTVQADISLAAPGAPNAVTARGRWTNPHIDVTVRGGSATARTVFLSRATSSVSATGGPINPICVSRRDAAIQPALIQYPANGAHSASVQERAFGTPMEFSGTGSPEGVVTAVVGARYIRTDGGAGATLYVKETGTGNTGWAAK